jgi:hypothetical protein
MKRLWVMACVAALAAGACKVVKNEGGGGSVSVKDLRITDEVSGWTEKTTEGYVEFNTKGFYDLINGGAKPYEDQEMIEGIMQDMSASEGRECMIYVIDFGTDQKAEEMFLYQKSRITSLQAVGNYPEAMVAADASASNYAMVYAHFGKFYVELLVMEELSQALGTADLFLEHYEDIAL